ncbi:MAG: hypothetical protein IT204_15505 [Fimbriimonadaceae bacterium]|nr:hypothetical protein [Fimbriimonadaceae bacterium]
MDLPLLGYLEAVEVARSPEPERVYYSNPDWALDDQGPLLLWDQFGPAHNLFLARPAATGWQQVATLPDTMHSHLIHLPEQGLSLILGVNQQRCPRSLDLWWSYGADRWQGPLELFGAADFHAGSTPWAIHQDRLFVPFETQQTERWGSYEYGCVHARLDSDLRRPANWTLVQNRVPWSVLPNCFHCGGLEGNLIVAPDGQLYNFLRLPAYNRLGRARWNGSNWEWLGLVQGVHNQSKPEIFSTPDGRWFLLANGWPARRTPNRPHDFRNTLCLWEACEPDLSRWRLLRVIISDREPRHAYSYVAAMVDPSDTFYLAERAGDDQTRNFHDTNLVLVRQRPQFSAWVEEPALVPYGTAAVDASGVWSKSNSQDGLLLSHLDGATYPQVLRATVRIDELPSEVGVLDLLGFATCDLISIAGLQLANEGSGTYLALSTGGRRIAVRPQVRVGEVLRLQVTLRSPVQVVVQVDDDQPVKGRTHLASDPSLAGILPRADRPTARLGQVSVVERPSLATGDTVCEAPALPGALILVDGRGVTGPLAGDFATPAENLVPGGPLVGGGHPAWFEPWAGGVLSGPKCAALWSPLDQPPAEFTLGGFGRLGRTDPGWNVLLAAFGERSATYGLRRELPYLGLLLLSEGEAQQKLAVAWSTCDDKEMTVANETVGSWFFYALTGLVADGELQLQLYAGEPGGRCWPVCTTTAPLASAAAARHWLALIGSAGNEVRGFGGLFVCQQALTHDELQGVCQAGYATKMDRHPPRRATCAVPLPSAPAPVDVAPAPPAEPVAPDLTPTTVEPAPEAPPAPTPVESASAPGPIDPGAESWPDLPLPPGAEPPAAES